VISKRERNIWRNCFHRAVLRLSQTGRSSHRQSYVKRPPGGGSDHKQQDLQGDANKGRERSSIILIPPVDPLARRTSSGKGLSVKCYKLWVKPCLLQKLNRGQHSMKMV
jgi:hypothetical protein